MLGHPSFARLRDFALDESDDRRRRDVARHLGRCPRCRSRIQSIREIVSAACEPVARAPLPFATIAERIASGPRVLVAVEPGADAPVSDGSRRVARPRRRRLAGIAALLLVLVAGTIVIGVPEAIAESSELWITPAAPRRGESIALRYRATARLSGHDRLVVRGRYGTAVADPQPRLVTLGELRRVDDAVFEGRITLPDSAVYAVLAVEDSAASFVDANGERWEVLVHGDDGRPLFDALRQRYADVRMRNTRDALETVRRMVTLYPDQPAGWYYHFSEQAHVLPEDARDSLRAAHLAGFSRLESAVRSSDGPSPDELWFLLMHARVLDDRATSDRLRDELIARFPRSGATLQQRAFMAAAHHRGNTRAYLAALDSLWRLAPAEASQAMFDAFRAARSLGDPDEMLRWTERLEAVRPSWAAGNGMALVEHAATREAGLARLRASLDRSAAAEARPLGMSRAEHERKRRQAAGNQLAILGRALLAAGRQRAALDTLDLALTMGWSPDLFRTVADVRLQLGDTTGAVAAYAGLVADPNTTYAFADSLRSRLGAHVTGSRWTTMVTSARDTLRRELLDTSIDRAPLRAELRLRTLSGDVHPVRLDDDGGLTVVAFWSRFCPPSLFELPRLDEALQRLRERGVRVIAIADESDGTALRRFLDARGHSLPTYLDPDRDAHNAFDNRLTPNYVVLDARGRIRFTSSSTADLVRHVAVLGGPWEGAR